MAERRTKEVLLRLRRARELELRRELVGRRADRAEARRLYASVSAERHKLERGIGVAQGRRAAGSKPIPVGRLALADAFERGLRESLGAARVKERRALAQLDAAEASLEKTQRALADALGARQRSESLAAAERSAALRASDRRDHAEAEDRYRSPGRGLSRRKR